VDRQSRRGMTKAFLRDGAAPGTTRVMVCVADSITEGGGSADWDAMLHQRLVELLAADHAPPQFSSSSRPIVNSLFQYYVRRRTCDEAAASHGLILLTDNTHLGERAGSVIRPRCRVHRLKS
jgi:hypothetical protein